MVIMTRDPNVIWFWLSIRLQFCSFLQELAVLPQFYMYPFMRLSSILVPVLNALHSHGA